MTALRDAPLPAIVSTIYRSRAAITRQYVPSYIRIIHTEGAVEPGDGGGETFERVSAEPAHDDKVQSRDGSWFEKIVVEDALASLVGLFDSYADADGAFVAPYLSYVTLLGYYSPHDGGGGGYAEAESEPTHDGKFQSADGRWWELQAEDPDPLMFGAKCDVLELTDVSITASSTTASSTGTTFTSAYAGKRVLIEGAGTNAAGLRTTVASVSGGDLILANAAGTTVSDALCFVASDDTVAFKRCWIYADAKDRFVTLSAKRYYIGSPESNLTTATQFLISTAGKAGIVGPGREICEVIYDDTRVGGTTQTANFYGGTGSQVSAVRSEYVRFEGVQYRGTLDFHGKSSDGESAITTSYFLLGYSVNKLSIEKNSFVYMRHGIAAPRQCSNVVIDKNYIFKTPRDGFFTQTCGWVEITNNQIFYTDDDAIQVGSQGSSSTGDFLIGGGVVSGNYLWGSGPIKLSGTQGWSVTGNTTVYSHRSALRIQDEDTGNPKAASAVCTVSGNAFINTINSIEAGFAAANSAVIFISGNSASGGTVEDAIPGDNDSATGEIIPFYDYLMTNPTTDGNNPVGPAFNIIFANNVVGRTSPLATNFSDLGYGTMCSRDDYELDPELTQTLFDLPGIQLYGIRHRNILISNNAMSGTLNGVQFVPVAAASGVIKFDNIQVLDNIFFDMKNAGIAGGTNIRDGNINARIVGNMFDMDPFHLNADRGADGSWTAYDDLPAIEDLAVGVSTNRGLEISRNTFRNCSTPFAAVSYDTAVTHFGEGNVVEATLVSVGFSTSNLGVGDLPFPSPTWRVRHVDFDPNNSTYGTVLNDCPLSLGAMPTSGTWLQGQIVWHSGYTLTTGHILLGWKRMTTGSGHVLNTDWAAIYAPVSAS